MRELKLNFTELEIINEALRLMRKQMGIDFPFGRSDGKEIDVKKLHHKVQAAF